MRIDILTVVPELLASPLNESILKRAQEKGLVEIHIHNIRDYTEDKHRTTDDYPFGGEAGMVMKIEPIYRCIEALKAEREYDEVIYTSPDGIRYDQHEANRLSTLDNLIKGLKAHDPEAKFRFWGGDKMAGVGGSGNLAKHYKETSFFGIVEVIKNLRTIRRQMKECRQDVEAFAPDVLILVDYPGFNMKMARWAKEHGIRVFYYIAPKVWAWREWRVKAIRKYVDELFIIFPFERDYFPKHGIRPIFEGNPLVDAIEARRASLPSPDEFRRRHALDERPIVALLAGSRRSEIKANLPLMADLARKFPDRQFVVTGVSWLDRSIYEQYIADSGIRYVCDQTYETLAAAEAAVVTSGTATLETALLNVPEVVVYRTLWFQVKLQPYVLKVPYVSLVNLNLGRESVVEIIQSDLDITRAERELRAILTGGEKRERMLRDFAELQAVIGAPGASDRFAARMVELLKKQVR